MSVSLQAVFAPRAVAEQLYFAGWETVIYMPMPGLRCLHGQVKGQRRRRSFPPPPTSHFNSFVQVFFADNSICITLSANLYPLFPYFAEIAVNARAAARCIPGLSGFALFYAPFVCLSQFRQGSIMIFSLPAPCSRFRILHKSGFPNASSAQKGHRSDIFGRAHFTRRCPSRHTSPYTIFSFCLINTHARGCFWGRRGFRAFSVHLR